MTETEIKKDIMHYLKNKNWLVFRLHTTAITRKMQMCPPGTPDLLAISPDGRTVWIEVKTPSGRMRMEQTVMFFNLNKRKQEVIIADSIKDVEDMLNDRATKI